MKGMRIVAALFALSLGGCGDGSIQSPDFTSELGALQVIAGTPDQRNSANVLPAGASLQLIAQGKYTTAPDGELEAEFKDVEAKWTSSAPSIATVDSSKGLVTAVATGTATITASKDGKTADFSVVVGPAEISSLIIIEKGDSTDTPVTSKSIALGSVQDYEARAVYTDGSVRNITTAVTFTTSDEDIACLRLTSASCGAETVGSTTTEALAQKIGGPVTITASTTGLDPATTELTVTDATLTGSLSISPTGVNLRPGETQDFNVYGEFSDGTTQKIDSEVDFVSSAPSVAAFEGSANTAAGVITAVANGDATVTGTLKSGVGTGITPNSVSATVHVTDSVCTSELLAADGATASDATDATICIGCGVTTPEAVIDADDATSANLGITVGLLDGMSTLNVVKGTPATTFPGGGTAGFIIGQSTGSLVLAELFSQIQVATLKDGAVQESSGDRSVLRLDLLGQKVIDGTSNDLALVTIDTSIPYDGVQLSLKSGTASVLTSVQAYSACGTTQPPDAVPALTSLTSIEPTEASIEVGKAQSFTAQGTFADGSTGAIPDNYLSWTSSSDVVTDATSTTGVFNGKAAGTATIKATLGENVDESVTPRSASATLTVTPTVCSEPLLDTDGATVEHSTSALCLLCSVTNDNNVIDATTTNYATITLNLGVLATADLDVLSNATTDFPATNTPGFIIGLPVGNVALAQVLADIKVSTLDADGEVIETGSSDNPGALRLDLLGLGLIDESESGLVSFQPTQPYRSLRLTSSSGLASVLSTMQVYQACATTTQ